MEKKVQTLHLMSDPYSREKVRDEQEVLPASEVRHRNEVAVGNAPLGKR